MSVKRLIAENTVIRYMIGWFICIGWRMLLNQKSHCFATFRPRRKIKMSIFSTELILHPGNIAKSIKKGFIVLTFLNLTIIILILSNSNHVNFFTSKLLEDSKLSALQKLKAEVLFCMENVNICRPPKIKSVSHDFWNNHSKSDNIFKFDLSY